MIRTIGESGFHFFNLAEVLEEIEQEKRELCAPFGAEVLRGDMLMVRMVDAFSWGTSFDAMLGQFSDNIGAAMERIGQAMTAAIQPALTAFAAWSVTDATKR